MKTLKLEKLEGKRLTVFLVEKEYNEPFYLLDSPLNALSKNIHDLFRPSISFCLSLEEAIEKVNPDFAIEELGMRTPEDFYKYNVLTEIFKKRDIPLYYVDIDEYAKCYFANELYEKRALLNSLNGKRNLNSKTTEAKTENIADDYFESYAVGLEADLEETWEDINISIREKWIVMGLLKKTEKIEKEDVTCIYICSPVHLEGIKTILSSLNVDVQVLKLRKKVLLTYTDEDEIRDLVIQPPPSLQTKEKDR